ncbi:MAG: transcription antitermination factor NusB, partial [Oscillospiraceae bacterium]|nr:transcription antitermination factor NusB [Candidatus Equicaccousia limihippi]
LIFEEIFNNDTPENIVAASVESREFETTDYILTTFSGVVNNKETIDRMISENLNSWTIERISKTALAILRLAVYEIMFAEDIPESVSANEAVELAKIYCKEDDAKFINGVLSSVIKKVNG